MATNGGRLDDSQLQPAIPAGPNGFVTLFNGFQFGTKEVKNLLTYECDPILECKLCRNLFRSLPTFVAHKRVYCKESAFEQVHNSNSVKYANDEEMVRPLSTESCPNETIIADDTNEEAKSENGTDTNVNPRMQLFTPVRKDNQRHRDSRNASKQTLNFLSRLAKRETMSLNNNGGVVKVPLHRLPEFNRIIPQTVLENGVQTVVNRADLNKLPRKDKKGVETDSSVTMVLPQDAAHRQHAMSLRTRRQFNAATFTKELSAEEVKIYEKLEHTGMMDVSTLSCLFHKCTKQFKDAKNAAGHLMCMHFDPQEKIYCFFCEDSVTFDDLVEARSHLQMQHSTIYQEYVADENSPQSGNCGGRKSKMVPLYVDPLSEEGSTMFGDNLIKRSPASYGVGEEDADEIVGDISLTDDEAESKDGNQSGEQMDKEDGDDNGEDAVENVSNTSGVSKKKSDSKRGSEKATKAQLPSSNLRAKRAFKSPYSSAEFVSWGPRAVKRPSGAADPPAARLTLDSPKPPVETISSSRASAADSTNNTDKFPVIFTQKQKEMTLGVMDEKEKRCKICGVQFSNKSNLERHCYMHLGFIRFKCSKCGIGSFYRTELRRHLRACCPNMKQDKDNPLPDEELNALISPACSQEPGRVVDNKTTTVWGRNFGRKGQSDGSMKFKKKKSVVSKLKESRNETKSSLKGKRAAPPLSPQQAPTDQRKEIDKKAGRPKAKKPRVSAAKGENDKDDIGKEDNEKEHVEKSKGSTNKSKNREEFKKWMGSFEKMRQLLANNKESKMPSRELPSQRAHKDEPVSDDEGSDNEEGDDNNIDEKRSERAVVSSSSDDESRLSELSSMVKSRKENEKANPKMMQPKAANFSDKRIVPTRFIVMPNGRLTNSKNEPLAGKMVVCQKARYAFTKSDLDAISKLKMSSNATRVKPQVNKARCEFTKSDLDAISKLKILSTATRVKPQLNIFKDKDGKLWGKPIIRSEPSKAAEPSK